MQLAREVPATDRGGPLTVLGLAGPRAVLSTFAILLAFAAIAWYLTVQQVIGMAGMSGPGEMAAPLFMGMWLTMMVAMMFPTIGPMVLAHRGTVRRQGGSRLATACFVLGYLIVWSLIGLVPLAAFIALRGLPVEARTDWFPFVAGTVLVVAGAYQFTAWKQLCLKTCRSPFTFLLAHHFMARGKRRLPGDFRLGLTHGAYCLGCCWALMAVLVVVGLMNLVWMVGITGVFLAEKNLWHGALLARVTGAATLALGGTILVHPTLFSSISSPLFGMSM
jgi:predicted metal-binding membrane protein